MSSDRGSIPIFGALIISVISALGVKAVIHKDSETLRTKNVLEMQALSKQSNFSDAQYSRGLLSWPNPTQNVGGISDFYPSVYLKDYFQTAAESCGGVDCFPLEVAPGPVGSQGPRTPWLADSNGLLSLPSRTVNLSLSDAASTASFFNDPQQAGIPGKVNTAARSKTWISNVIRDSSTKMIHQLELSIRSRPQKFGLASVLMPEIVSKYRVNMEPPPNPLVYVDYLTGTDWTSGVNPQYITAQEPFRIRISARGITPRAKLTLVGYPHSAMDNCPAEQGIGLGLPQRDDDFEPPIATMDWENGRLLQYDQVSGPWTRTAVWQCWFPKLDTMNRATINTRDPDGPAPTTNYATSFNVAGLSMNKNDSTNPLHTAASQYNCPSERNPADGYCPTDLQGPSVPVIKKPNCRLNIHSADPNEPGYMHGIFIHNFDYSPFRMFVRTYGMVWPNATNGSGAKIRVTKWDEWQADWDPSSTVIVNLEHRDAAEEATGSEYSTKPGGKSPSFSGAIFGRWEDAHPALPRVKQWLTFFGDFQPSSPGRYLIVGEVSGPGGTSDCAINSREGLLENLMYPFPHNTAYQWPAPEIRNATWNGVSNGWGSFYADVSSPVSVTWEARGHSECRVMRYGSVIPVCHTIGQSENGAGSFERWYNYSCNLDGAGTVSTEQYQIQCWNPKYFPAGVTQDSEVIKRTCPGAGGPNLASYVGTDPAAMHTCSLEIASGIGGHNSPDSIDCNRCAGVGLVWCDAAPLPYAYDAAWHGGLPSRCHCNNGSTGIANPLRFLPGTYSATSLGGCGW